MVTHTRREKTIRPRTLETRFRQAIRNFSGTALVSKTQPNLSLMVKKVALTQLDNYPIGGCESMRLNKQAPLYQLADQCRAAVSGLHNRSENREAPQKSTTQEYLRLAATLIKRSYHTPGGLSEALQKTECSSTFYKRLAAVHYALLQHHEMLMERLTETASDAQSRLLMHQFNLHLSRLMQLSELQETGFISTRRKRLSKRQALRGLPANWRHDLYLRAGHSKYSLPILVASLTGCRPAELQHGVAVCREIDPVTGEDFIAFCIRGAKVKSGQGQPRRIIKYSVSDPHPLVREICKFAYCSDDVPVQEVKIESAVNFTVEVRRLASNLWPQHRQSVTAYCFRHQWAADMKAFTDGDSVSRGLGHASAKTRRTYGTAGQGGKNGLTPLAIVATNPVRTFMAESRYRSAPTSIEPW